MTKLSLMCSKFYQLFLPALPKKLTTPALVYLKCGDIFIEKYCQVVGCSQFTNHLTYLCQYQLVMEDYWVVASSYNWLSTDFCEDDPAQLLLAFLVVRGYRWYWYYDFDRVAILSVLTDSWLVYLKTYHGSVWMA